MASVEIQVGGETESLQIDDRFVELLEEVNAAVGRELSLERFAAQAIHNSATAIEQSIEQSIVCQHQAVREADKEDVPLERVSESWQFSGRGD